MEENTIYDRLGQTSSRFKALGSFHVDHTTFDLPLSPTNPHITATVIDTLICPTYSGDTHVNVDIAIRFAGVGATIPTPPAVSNYNAMVATHIFSTGVLPDKTGQNGALTSGYAGNGGMVFAAPDENLGTDFSLEEEKRLVR